MYKVKFSARSFLRTNKNKDGTQTVGLRVTYLGKSKDYTLEIKLSSKDYKQIKKGTSIRIPNLILIKREIEDAGRRADSIFKELGSEFSFNRFEDKYFGTSEAKNGLKCVLDVINEYINTKANKLSTNLGYETLKNKIIQFQGNISIKELDEIYFEKFKSYLYKSGLSDNTVIIYLRYLKATIRHAQEKGYIKSFKVKVASARILKSRGYYLTEEQSNILFTYAPKCYYEERALDYFKMSIYMYGANMIDILSLKKQNISHSEIKFYRTKVNATSRNGQIKVGLSEELRTLIDKYREDNAQNDYLFPTLAGKASEKQRRNSVNSFSKNINKFLKKISYEIGLEVPITMYCARHTFSTFMLNNTKTKTTDLKELLGHSSIKSTEHYIHSLINREDITKSLKTLFKGEIKATMF